MAEPYEGVSWFTLYDDIAPVEAPTTTPVVESAPLVTAKPVEAKPEPKPAAQETPQSQPVQREHQEWRKPLESSTSPSYIDAKTVAGMLGVSELDVIARSDFAGGTLPSIDTGVGKLYDRADVLAHLKQEGDGKSEFSAVAEALASGNLYLQPARC